MPSSALITRTLPTSASANGRRINRGVEITEAEAIKALGVARAARHDAWLAAVAPGGPAATAGFRDGDVIVEVDGVSVTELSPRSVGLLILNRPPGTRIRLGAMRDGKPVSGEIVLGPVR